MLLDVRKMIRKKKKEEEEEKKEKKERKKSPSVPQAVCSNSSIYPILFVSMCMFRLFQDGTSSHLV